MNQWSKPKQKYKLSLLGFGVINQPQESQLWSTGIFLGFEILNGLFSTINYLCAYWMCLPNFTMHGIIEKKKAYLYLFWIEYEKNPTPRKTLNFTFRFRWFYGIMNNSFWIWEHVVLVLIHLHGVMSSKCFNLKRNQRSTEMQKDKWQVSNTRILPQIRTISCFVLSSVEDIKILYYSITFMDAFRIPFNLG